MKVIKWSFIVLSITFFALSCNSCKDDDKEDLTQDTVGEYIGLYTSNALGDINDYSIVISEVSENRIRIAPKTGNEFEAWETNLERFNSSTITTTIGQVDPVIFFTIGETSTGITIERASEGEEYSGVSQ